MQLHASPLHDSSSQQHNPQLLYSPVRQGSPSPEEAISPVLNDDIALLRSANAEQQQGTTQQDGLEDGRQAGTLSYMQQQQQPRLAAATQAASRSLPSARSTQQQVSLCCLPREVQMRVLCFLSADSLTSLAHACSQFSSLCGEPVLWRRLFVHRWGKTRGHNQAQSWKVSFSVACCSSSNNSVALPVKMISTQMVCHHMGHTDDLQWWHTPWHAYTWHDLLAASTVPYMHLVLFWFYCSHIFADFADITWVHSAAQVRYMERDAAELEAAGAGAQHRDVMQDIFLQVGWAGFWSLLLGCWSSDLSVCESLASLLLLLLLCSGSVCRGWLFVEILRCSLLNLTHLTQAMHAWCLHCAHAPMLRTRFITHIHLTSHPTIVPCCRLTRPSGTSLWASGLWMTSCWLRTTKSLPGFWPGASLAVLQHSRATAHSQSAPQTWLYPKGARVQRSTRLQGLRAGACQTLARGLVA
jgi:hypothetical protein